MADRSKIEGAKLVSIVELLSPAVLNCQTTMISEQTLLSNGARSPHPRPASDRLSVSQTELGFRTAEDSSSTLGVGLG